MARNSENAPSEPSGRRRKLPEGGSPLRQHFRDSIRDALSGVDVDALQGERTLPVPTDVTVLTREAVTDLEAELAALRAERAELERRASERSSAAAAAVAVVVEEAPAEVAPAPAPPRRMWRRERVEAEVVPPKPESNGAAVESRVAWSVSRAMEAVPEAASAAPQQEEIAAPAREPVAREAVAPVAPPAAPEALAPPIAPEIAAPAPRPRRRRPQALTDTELESVVAPLLTELANLRAEVRNLRGDPESHLPIRPSNRQMVKLVAGVLVGFALIVVALAVVLKA